MNIAELKTLRENNIIYIQRADSNLIKGVYDKEMWIDESLMHSPLIQYFIYDLESRRCKWRFIDRHDAIHRAREMRKDD